MEKTIKYTLHQMQCEAMANIKVIAPLIFSIKFKYLVAWFMFSFFGKLVKYLENSRHDETEIDLYNQVQVVNN